MDEKFLGKEVKFLVEMICGFRFFLYFLDCQIYEKEWEKYIYNKYKRSLLDQ